MKKLNSKLGAQAAFLLGGIGTGNITLGARGELKSWELFNRPGKDNTLPYTFFCLRTEQADTVKMRILEARYEPPYGDSHGISPENLGGLPRFESCQMTAEYPFVRVSLKDPEVPVTVDLEAFTPFIPLDADNSGIPGAVLRYRVQNRTDQKVGLSLAGSFANPVGFEGYNIWERLQVAHAGKNEWMQNPGSGCLFYTCPDLAPSHLSAGSMSIRCIGDNLFHKSEWLNSGWWDGLQDFWNEFSETGRLSPISPNPPPGNEDTIEKRLKVGSLGAVRTIEAGESCDFTFILTWYFPNRLGSWNFEADYDWDTAPLVKNYYATLYSDARDVGEYLEKNLDWLEYKSKLFARALYSSSLPNEVIQAAANNITVLRSSTCFRIENGNFMGWEGCFKDVGCCEGSCNHVWNYAQTVAYLFPELERTMRRVEFQLELDREGALPHRSIKMLGSNRTYKPAVDGQLGTIIRFYRDWVLSGDRKFVHELWPKARLALEYVLRQWDLDCDMVLEGQQYVTYDIEFRGANSLTASLLLAALKALVKLAEVVGDDQARRGYEQLLECGSRQTDQLLWNGEYYQQQFEDVDSLKYQYGAGCLADQLFGQFLAHVSNLGYILPRDRVKSAIHAVYRHNFLRSFVDHPNTQRTYAVNDEQGLVLCTWPRGGRPRFPFVYANEVWTGVEYQVAAHLIYEGLVKEGLEIVKAVQDRYDGEKRNPWNEVECGNHYVRSMASWALLPALSGATYDPEENAISFRPKINEDDFRCFWITGKSWGIYRQTVDPVTGLISKKLEVLHGGGSEIRLAD